MLLIQGIITEDTKSPSPERDIVCLDWEARQKCRQRLKTEAGRELGLALPTGTVLSPGDILYRDADVEIVVEGIPEKVFVLRFETREEYALACYQIGNLHRPIGFDKEAILVPYESVLENQFCRLGFHFTIEKRVFTHAARQSHFHRHVH